MSLSVVLTPDARDDLDDARAWYEAQQAGRGDAFLDEVRDQLAVIEQNPHQYGRSALLRCPPRTTSSTTALRRMRWWLRPSCTPQPIRGAGSGANE